MVFLASIVSAEIIIDESEFSFGMYGGQTKTISFDVSNTGSEIQSIGLIATIFNSSGDTNGFETEFSSDQFELGVSDSETIFFTITTSPSIQPEVYTISIIAFATEQVTETIIETITVENTKYVSRGSSGSTKYVYKDRNVLIEIPVESDSNRVDELLRQIEEDNRLNEEEKRSLRNKILGLENQDKNNVTVFENVQTEPQITTPMLIGFLALVLLALIGVIGIGKSLMNKYKKDEENKNGDEKQNE